ncbi:MAG: hypothetical protein WBQ75_03405 [Acetobacteraceae bacterium]
MAYRDHLFLLLGFVALVLAALTAIYLETAVHGWVMAGVLAAWGLLSLPVGFLAGHYCALGNDPTH